MIIATVCKAKNEEVLIESFVRYAFTFSDFVLVYDHNSTDGTADILSALREEYGDRLVLFSDGGKPTLAHNQPAVTDKMVKYAIEILHADFVLPLDADEFPIIESEEGISIRDFLNNLPKDRCFQVYWRLYSLPVSGLLDGELFVPLAFNRRRNDIVWRWPKSIISAECYRKNPVHVTMGNHNIYYENRDDSLQIDNLTPPLYYAHFSCRGLEHYLSKITSGWLACAIRQGQEPGESMHYRFAYERVIAGEVPDDEELEWFSLTGGGLTGETIDDISDKIEIVRPRDCFPDIKLKYTKCCSKNKDKFELLMESSFMLVEEYLSLQNSLNEKSHELEQFIFLSKTWKVAAFFRKVKVFCFKVLRKIRLFIST